MTLVLSVFPGFAVGGAQARFCAVANHNGRLFRHAIVAMNGNVDCRERLDAGLSVQFLNVAAVKNDPIGTLRRLRAVLTQVQPDVLLTHNWGSIEWALANASRFGREPVRHLHVEDGFGPEERHKQLRRRVWMRRLALRHTTVALPSRVLMRMARQTWRLAPERLRFVPNGVDLDRFAEPTDRLKTPAPTWPGAASGPVVGTVAALRPEKNIARLLRAVALVPGLRLVVVGDGPDRAMLTALSESLALESRVAFAGHLADPALAYRQMDVFALSSDTEQMPLSILEAMAAGLPIATTRVGDVAEMVAAENLPFVVDCDDSALALALTRLATDRELRQKIGMANRTKAVQEYGQAKMLRTWSRLLSNPSMI